MDIRLDIHYGNWAGFHHVHEYTSVYNKKYFTLISDLVFLMSNKIDLYQKTL